MTTVARKPPRARRTAGVSPAVWRGAIGVLALIVVLELVSRSGLIRTSFLPPFDEVLIRMVTLWGDPTFLRDVGATVSAYLLSMAIAIAVAVPLGVVLGLARPIYRATRAVIELVRPIPPVALIPLVLLVAGSGLQLKLVVAVFAAVWPIIFNTLYGVHDVDPYAKDMARSFHLGRFGIVRRIVLPSAAPFIMTGVRVASSIALIVVVTVELVAGGAEGVGAFIARERANGYEGAYTNVLAATLAAGFIGLVINLLIGGVERKFFGWDATTKESA
ncbi:MAG TPA: ABC transporter permease [Microbacteriaceae bacterium]|nr:ABC transporter permease [Microbacteriaceae bacterium]